MILSAKSTKDFIPAPAGLHDGICVDVVDMGIRDSDYGPKPKLRLVFQLDPTVAAMEDGKPFLVGQIFTASIYENAALRKFITQWRGRDFTPEEASAFDPENMLLANAQLVVAHERKGQDVYANIIAVMKPKKKLIFDPSTYTRVKDRQQQGQQRQQRQPGQPMTTQNYSFPHDRPQQQPAPLYPGHQPGAPRPPYNPPQPPPQPQQPPPPAPPQQQHYHQPIQPSFPAGGPAVVLGAQPQPRQSTFEPPPDHPSWTPQPQQPVQPEFNPPDPSPDGDDDIPF